MNDQAADRVATLTATTDQLQLELDRLQWEVLLLAMCICGISIVLFIQSKDILGES